MLRSAQTMMGVLLASLGMIACEQGTAPFECSATVATIVPDSAVIAVGDTVTLRLTSLTGTCLPPDTAAAARRWRLPPGPDSQFVKVDSLSGHTTAIAPGKADVWLMTVSGTLLGGVPVTVTP